MKGFNWLRKPEPEPPPAPPAPPPIDPAAFATVAKAPVFNPTAEDQVKFAEYRADAIARELEQRAQEGRDRHPDHDAMIAEAMSYAWMLVGAGKWETAHVAGLQARLLKA